MIKQARPVPSDIIMSEHPPYFLELELTRHVAGGEMNNALAVLKHINTFKRATLARSEIRSLKNSLICNCTFLARAAIDGGAPFELAFKKSDELILKIEDQNSVTDLKNIEEVQIKEFVKLVHDSEKKKFSKAIRSVINYVSENLDEELSLTKLSEISGHNPNYLSSIFRKETGTRLSDYVMKKRLEDAKFLLCHTDSPISDISNYYRFSSQSHFTTRFSKFTGMTPLQYRKSLGGMIDERKNGK